jgi:hypothetical protein
MVTTTKARTPAGSGVGTGTGAKYIVDATQVPTARTFAEVAGRVNRLLNVDEVTVSITGSSSGEVLQFVALDNGRVEGLYFRNGATACDGSNGWRILVQNEGRSDAEVADFGAGTGSNAAAANDSKAVDASVISYFSNSLTATTSYFTKGDSITIDVTEDGTAGAADLVLVLNYGAQGWEA